MIERLKNSFTLRRCDGADNLLVTCSVEYNEQMLVHCMPDKGYLFLNDDQRLDVASLLTTLKSAGVVKNETDFQKFVTDCFLCGLYKYKKELVRSDC